MIKNLNPSSLNHILSPLLVHSIRESELKWFKARFMSSLKCYKTFGRW